MPALRPLMLGTLMAALALPALAQPAPPPAPPADGPAPRLGPGAIFAMVDSNGDGRVVFAEVWSFAQARFAEADRNKDGALVLEEALAFRPMRAPDAAPPAEAPPMRARMVAAVFRAVDANSDGRVTLEEIRPALEAQFRALDANGDRGITRDELPVPPHGMHRGGAGMHPRGMAGAPPQGGPGAPPPPSR